MSLFFSFSRMRLACLTILFLLSSLAHAAGPPPDISPAPSSGDALLRQLTEQGRRLKGLQSGFRQTRRVAFMDEELVSEGFFRYKAPGYLLWEYTTPLTFSLEYNNGEARFHSNYGSKAAPEGGSAPNRHEAALASGLARHIMVWMSMDMARIRTLYNVTVSSSSPLTLQLAPVKASPGSPMLDMEVTFAANNLDVKRIIMREKDGDFTRLDFFDTRREE